MPELDASAQDIKTIEAILSRFVPEYEVRAFGSRVIGNATKHSDLDLAVMTKQPLPIGRLAELKETLSDSDLPFAVDIVDWASISEAFRKIIVAQSAIVQEAHSGKGLASQEGAEQ